MRSDDTRITTPEVPAEGAATVLRPETIPIHGIPPGTLLVNTYRVERLLGGGGMGEVYLASHAGLGTRHAIKVIRPAMALNRQVMDLFYREAKVLRGVRNDAVVSYDGFVRDDQGRDYLVMEYVEGPSLADRLRRGPLSPSDVITLRDRLAAGLAEAHRKGAVHRDISPDNVILPGNQIDAAKLIDFGLCKLTDPGQETIIGSSFAGKYRYASPEQFGLYGGAIDARSDIYSLGLILGAAAQGRPLEMGESFEAALRSRQTVPDLSKVPASLRDWISAMLQPDPAARPGSLDELLERWPAGGTTAPDRRAGGAAPRSPTGSGPRAGVPRRPLWALLVVVLAGGAGGLYWLLRPLPVVEPQTGLPPPDSREISPLAEEPAASPAVSTPSPEDLGQLTRAGRLDEAFERAQGLLGSGSPPPRDETWALAQALRGSGRLDHSFALMRELANGGYGPAALGLAEMYDPLHWSADTSPFSRPNPTKAREWYRRASESGMTEASGRLQALDGLEEQQ